MPTYTYRHREAADCPNFQEVARMADDPLRACPSCGGAVVRIVTRAPGIKIPHHLKGTMHDYREDLARFPNDPQAFVDGPRSLAKLIDQRKREGATIRPLSEAAGDPFRNDPKRNLAREAYEAAKARGFKPEED